MDPLPHDVFLSEVFRRLADAESLNIVLKREKSELVAKQAAQLPGSSSDPVQPNAQCDTAKRPSMRQEHVRRPEPGDLVHLRSLLNESSAALKAQQEDCQRIERERDLACRSWQLHFDNAQEYTRQLGAANAEINRLQSVLKEREDTIVSHVLSISEYERKTDSMKSRLELKEELLRQVTKEQAAAREYHSAQLSVARDSTNELSSRLQTCSIQLNDSQALVQHLESEMLKLEARLTGYQTARENERQAARYDSEQVKVLMDSKLTLESTVTKQQAEIESLRTTVQGLQKPPVTSTDCGVQVVKITSESSTQTTLQAPDIRPQYVTSSTQTTMIEPQTLQNQPPEKPYTPSITHGLVAPLTPVSQLSTFTRSPSLSSLSTLTDTTEDHSPSFRVIDIPAAFKKELARFPVINIPISANWNDQTVSLQELHVNLGGNQFNVVSRFEPPRKALAVRHEILGCIFLRRRLNPWAPPRPGQHGYMFVGNWNDDDPFCKPTEFALFLPEDKAETRWRYYGQYLVQGDVPLLPRQWRELPDDFREDYYSMVYARLRGSTYEDWTRREGYIMDESDLQEIRAEHSVAASRVPRIQMICVGYHQDLIQDLSSGRRLSTREIRPTWKRKDASNAESSKGGRGSTKKRRVQ